MIGRRVQDDERRGTVVDQDGDRVRIVWDDDGEQWCRLDDVQVIGG